MKNRPVVFPHWRWRTLLAVGAVACFLLFHWAAVNTVAQDQTPAPANPAETQAKPPEAPAPSAETQAKPPEAAEKPAEPPAKPAEPAAKPEEPKAPAPAAAEEKPKAEKEELTNQSCYDCHNPDILKLSKEDRADQVVVSDKPLPPRARPPYVFGELGLSLDEKKYAKGMHADTTCITCHNEVKELPHAQRLKNVDCKECHDEYVDNIKASAHGDKAGPKAPPCIGCHDVHNGLGKAEYAADFKRKVCMDCHKAYGLDTLKGHQKLYEPEMHLKIGCMLCHEGASPGVHNIAAVKTKVAGCESCHTKNTVLSKEKRPPVGLWDRIKRTTFINADSLKQFGYVLGANRIPALDAIIILAIVAPLGLPVFHGGLRILKRRKGKIHLPEEKIYLHPLPERIWHWFQALCIVMLIITGAMLHWPEKFPGWFDWSVTVHNWFGIGAVVAWVFWLVYNLVTRRLSHYIPKKGDIPTGMITQAKFYGYGIFKHEPHPYAPSEDNKFNPLQKIAYLKFQLLLFPLLLISGILYMYPGAFRGIINALGGMWVLALIHFILAALFTAFLVAHLYLATTGETVGENFKAIITGYGIKEEHHEH